MLATEDSNIGHRNSGRETSLFYHKSDVNGRGNFFNVAKS